MRYSLLHWFLLWSLCQVGVVQGAEPGGPSDAGFFLLFSYFVGNGEDGLHLASSRDGFHWTALKHGRSFLAPNVGKKLMRDPCLIQGPDDVFHLVWTTGWGDRVIGYASSRDLIHWSPQRAIPVMMQEPTARNAWAPELFYDEDHKQFLIFWASTIPGRFPETDRTGDDGWNHRIYATTTRDFKTFTPTKLFFDGGFNVIDATILKAQGQHHLIVKDETKTPVKKNLRVARSAKAEGPYRDVSGPISISWVEGPSAIHNGEEFLIYFDHYAAPQYYGALRSRDLVHWEDISRKVEFPKGTRHGTVLRVSEEVFTRLQSPEVRFRHIVVDAAGPTNPWLKTVGDLNGDRRADLIVGGHSGGGLVWYENPTWKKHVIDSHGHFGTDAEVADVDHDKKPDIICITDGELRWYRNPDWKRFVIGRDVLHDIEVADFDGDGEIEIVGRNQGEFGHRGDRLHFYKQQSPAEWIHRELEIPSGEGLCVADIDADGKPDIVLETLWFRNPGDFLHGAWSRHSYTKTWTYHNTFVAVGDINGDGRRDIVLAPSELKGGKYRVSWFEAPADRKQEDWPEHVVENSVENVQHFVGVGDIDLDGELDIVTAAMHQGTPPQEVKIHLNRGKGTSWRQQVIATTGSHSMRLVDLHNDGRTSLFGANHEGKKIELWENLLPVTRPRSVPTNR